MTARSHDADDHRLSRRDFARRLGIGAGAVATGAPAVLLGGPEVVAAHNAAAGYQNPLNFGRMFDDDLPPFAEPTDSVKAALREIGAIGGIMDAGDDLAAGPLALILDPLLRVNNPDNPNHTAGTTFVGQFIDHDVTFDVVSRLAEPTDPTATRNARVPVLDLDSVYGGGPRVSPQLYEPADRAKFIVASGGLFEDVPRTVGGSAIIADPRNDENMVISGLQAAFLTFHNNLVDLVRHRRLVPDPGDVSEVFGYTRYQTRWHYQSMILTQYLPQVIGQSTVDDIRRWRRFYRPGLGRAYMPVEFQTGVFRMGHSMVRPSYRANFTGQPAGKPNAPQFFGLVLDASQDGVADPDDLRGGCRSARRFIGWPTFFDFGDGNVRRNKLLDTKLSTPLFRLPLAAIASGDPPTSLAERNLLRHLTWSLPSGQTLAKVIGVPPLSSGELAGTGIGSVRASFLTSTPLWFYILHEAFEREGGLRLGPVGGRVVGEVLIGLIDVDPASVLHQYRWRPLIPVREANKVSMQDVLDFAGVSGVR
jgi:hypothetical protein